METPPAVRTLPYGSLIWSPSTVNWCPGVCSLPSVGRPLGRLKAIAVDEAFFREDPEAFALYQPRSKVWLLAFVAVALAISGTVLHIVSHSVLSGGACLLGCLLIARIAWHRRREPLLWVSSGGFYLPRLGGIAWGEIEGVVVYRVGGNPATAIVATPTAILPLGGIFRRLDRWSGRLLTGQPVWASLPFPNPLSRADRLRLAEELDRRVTAIEPRGRLRRLMRWILALWS